MHGRFFNSSVMQMLAAMLFGLALGYAQPHLAVILKPLGDGFVKLISMNISLVVFVLVVSGIASLHDHRQSARIGGKVVIYFEVLALFSLLAGMAAALWLQPGAGLATLDTATAQHLPGSLHDSFNVSGFVLSVIPTTFVDAFMQGGNTLQVLFLAILFGMALARCGEDGAPIRKGIDVLAQLMFNIMAMILKLAPLAAFATLAYTVGRYGLSSMLPLAKLVLTLYLASALFIVIVFSCVTRIAGVRLSSLLRYIKEELLVVLLTTSSIAALPSLIVKMERLGCAHSIVRLVLPAGNALNLNGTNIYLAVCALFIAQAAHIDMNTGQLITFLMIAMLTSKGASAVAGSSFITLAVTLSALQIVPLEGVALLLSIERLMKCRSLTNLIGNAVACLAIAHWEKAIDRERLQQELGR
ncbi:aerobic C4-dicarboxylate transport protein [Pseudomonas migulae]|uniref:cation:dicarboxylate symporter family transporter n=1 Tax=Pseudomonas migulae TaxID=78543 RepID=UPI0020A119B4|nr:cation:dicarboxylase symporter family transporter [Pseudomonas migulae]MCP1496454.1 aerobic C4-dicarboxylate transport protein [Pseudomonas migulae]